MNLFPRPACGAQIGSHGHAGQLGPSADALPSLHVGVIRLCHIERLGGVLLRVSHVLTPLDKLLSGHGLYRSFAKCAGFPGKVWHKRYKSALLREKFGAHWGNHPDFLRRAAS